MKSVLIIVGSGSHVLEGFKAPRIFNTVIYADRSPNTSVTTANNIFIEYDLSVYTTGSKQVVDLIRGDTYDFIGIVFSSYMFPDFKIESDESHIRYMTANIHAPLELFQRLSNAFSQTLISGVFLSSIYAHVAPNPNNYTVQTPRNPFLYGPVKSAVETGLRWLSSQQRPHRFNSIALGPMPKANVLSVDQVFAQNLMNQIPANAFVSHYELHSLINYMLDPSCISLRGTTISLDGGYSIW
jgi:hypothetical protein